MAIDPWLPRAAALNPGRVALESGDVRLGYSELLARATASAGALDASSGGRVALALAPGPDSVVALHACLLAGVAAMPVDPRLGERERAAQLASADAGGCGRDDVALVVHTSGTTGAPLPVELTLGNVEANARGTWAALGLGDDERWLCPLPLSHVGGLMVLLRAAVFGTTAILGPATLAAGGDVTVASLVPTQLARLLDSGVRPGPRLKVVMLGGAPAGRGLLARAAQAGWPVAPSYGLTQACSAVTVAEPGDVETSGHPIDSVRVSIDDGEILVEGETVSGGGVLRTGDLGRLDGQGRLTVVGRRSDTIVTGGENVAPAEVEAVLLEHPAVADAGVFARPDPEWGEAVTARVVLRPGAEAGEVELRAWCADRLARFKVPKAIQVAAALPRSASGKLLRRELT